MKGDYTRFSHDPAKHYTGVLRQQGRLDLDADWNEHVQIVDRLEHIEAVDVIGRDGRPKRGNGFAVTVRPDGDLVLEQGHVYVGGTLCENEPLKVPVGFNSDTVVTVPERVYQAGLFRTGQLVLAEAPGQTAVTAQIASIATAASSGTRALTLGTGLGAIRTAGNATIRPRASYRFQPALPSPTALAPAVGAVDLLYVDVWQRHVTALEDADILEPALRGPDTTTRLQTVWQLRTLRVPAGTTCEQARALLPGASGGRLTTRPATVAPVDDPCFPTPTAGSGAIDNRLYRVEVHSPTATPPTFKWSRDNGSVAYPVEELVPGEGKKVKLARMGRDQVLALAAGDFVEIVGDEEELAGAPGLLTKVDAPPDVARRIVTLRDDVSSFAGRHHLKLRRWDHGINTEALLAADGATKTLDPGVEVQVGGSNLRAGDWWTFTTRAAGASRVEQIDSEAPHGVAHAYAPLALVTWAGSTTNWSTSTVVDCRPRFPALTEICADDVCYDDAPCSMGATTVDQALDKICGQRALRYVSGDGQEDKPNTELGPLQVGVEDGLGRPVNGVQVHFERISGDAVLLDAGGASQTQGDRASINEGIAATRVKLGPTAATSIIAASLATAAPQGTSLRILFRVVAENPPANGGKCTVTLGPGDSIAAGIQQLVSDSPAGGELCLRAGVYPIANPQEISKVHAPIRISGTGPGTVLKAANEAALVFSYCSHIEIANLRVEGGGNAAAPGDEHMRGALTFLSCKEISVTACELLCSDATANSRACVTVEPAWTTVPLRQQGYTQSATIKDNDMEVGAWQTGVLLTNVRETLVEGNRLRLRRTGAPQTWVVGGRPQLTQSFADLLVEALDPDRGNLHVNVDSLPQLTLRFRQDGRTEQILLEFGRLIDVQSMRGGPEAGLRRFATMVMNEQLGTQFTAFGQNRLVTLMHKMRAVDSGIVVGGTRADSVKVLDNFLSDAVRGIRVATGDIEAEDFRIGHPGQDKKVTARPSAKRAGDVLIRGNTIKGLVPEMFKRDRYAVMVGNAESVTIAETAATMERTVRGLVRHATPVEGVRLYGEYGPFVSVDRTSLRGFKTGVFFAPVKAPPKFRMWSVSKTFTKRGTALRDVRGLLTHHDANVP